MEFEWDQKKNIKNKKKHGVSFEDAKNVFFDPLRAEIYDHKNSKTEDRWIIYGRMHWVLFTVCCTENNGCIRIISARKATKKEEEEFYYGISTADSLWT